MSFRIHGGISLAPYRSSLQAWQHHASRVAKGKRILSAADDAAGLTISIKLSARYRGARMHMRNLQDQLSMLQTADGGLQESIALLHRLRELAVQAGSILTPQDKSALYEEASGMLDALRGLASGTRFNGRPLLGRELVQHEALIDQIETVPSITGLVGSADQIGSLTGASLTPDSLTIQRTSGNLLFRGSDGKIQLYNPSSNSHLKPGYVMSGGTTAAWGSNGLKIIFSEYVSSGTIGNQPVILSYNGATLSRTTIMDYLSGPGPSLIRDMKYSPVASDSSTPWAAFTRGLGLTANQDSIWLVNLGNPQEQIRWDAPVGEIQPLAFSAAGNKLYARHSANGQTAILELTVQGGQVNLNRTIATLPGIPTAWAVSQDNSQLAITTDSQLFALHLDTGVLTTLSSGSKITDLAWSPEGYLAAGDASGVVLYAPDKQSRRIISGSMGVNGPVALGFAPSGALVVAENATSPLAERSLDLEPWSYTLLGIPAGQVTASDGSTPFLSGNTVTWSWSTRPLNTSTNLQLSYQTLTIWQEDVTEPLLTDGTSELFSSNVTPEALGLTSWIAGNWADSIDLAINQMDSAIAALSADRATFGAWSNRLEHRYHMDETSQENHVASFAQISDADMAREIWQASKSAAQFAVSSRVILQATRLRASAISLLLTGSLPASY